MKKSRLFLVLVLAVFFLTACLGGNSDLTCTKSESDSGMDLNQSVTFKFEDDSPYLVDLTMDFIATEDATREYWSLLASGIEEEFASFDDKDGMEVEVTSNEATHTVSLNFIMDLRRVSTEDLSELNLEELADSTGNRASIRQAAEEDGFVCR